MTCTSAGWVIDILDQEQAGVKFLNITAVEGKAAFRGDVSSGFAGLVSGIVDPVLRVVAGLLVGMGAAIAPDDG